MQPAIKKKAFREMLGDFSFIHLRPVTLANYTLVIDSLTWHLVNVSKVTWSTA